LIKYIQGGIELFKFFIGKFDLLFYKMEKSPFHVKGLSIFFINSMGNCYMGNILDTVLVQDMVLELDTDRLHSQVIQGPPQLTLRLNLLQMVRRHIHNRDSDRDVRRDARHGVRHDARHDVRRDARHGVRRDARRDVRRDARHGVRRIYLYQS
jgi:hypothetical protein